MRKVELHPFYNILPELDRFRRILTNATVLRLVAFAGLFLVLAAVGFAFFENSGQPWYLAFFDGLWWALVTLATVGYGDKCPVTPEGKAVGMIVISGGVIIMGMFTATVASMMVESSIKEGKGLGTIMTRNHIVICGINRNLSRILTELSRDTKIRTIVLVNSMNEDEFGELRDSFETRAELRFVRGDYTRDTVLKRAAVQHAASVIILADSSETSKGSVDDRTILTTLAVKDIKPNVRICAELIDEEKKEHTERAGADEIIIQGGMSGYLLARGTMGPEVPQVFRELSRSDSSSALKSISFPPDFTGITFEEALKRMMNENSYVLVGVFREQKGFSLESMLSDGSAIDHFILEKLKNSGEDYLTEGKANSKIVINPGKDYIIQEYDRAVIIGV